MQPLDLSTLRTGQRVRYRTSTRDNASGTAPEWSGWKVGTLWVNRRAHPLPAARRRQARNPNVGDILELRIEEEPGFPGFSGSDYEPQFNEWLVEEYRLEFTVIPSAEPADAIEEP